MRIAMVMARLGVGLGAGLVACSAETAGRDGAGGLPSTGGATADTGGTGSLGGAGTAGGSGSGGETIAEGAASSGGAPFGGAPFGGSGGGEVTPTGGTTPGGGTTTSGGTTGGLATAGTGASQGSPGGGAAGSSEAAPGGGTTPSGGVTSAGGVAGGTTPLAGASGSSGAGGSGGAAGGGASGAAGQGPQACPDTLAALAAGDHTATLQHDGRARTYLLHVPSGVTGTVPTALVLDLHGAGGNGRQQRQMSGWDAVADREGFLAVYPDGIDGYWNVDDTCCGTAGRERIDDVGFLRAIVEELGRASCIDRRRIYVTGFSNGGGLTHRMGCDAADLVAAIAPSDTDLRTQPCQASRPISMIEFRGLDDTLEPYEGGVVGPPGGQYVSPGGPGSLALWAEINECTGTPATTERYCETYTQCAGGVETTLCSLPGVGHGCYNNTLGFDVASVAWSVFERQPLP